MIVSLMLINLYFILTGYSLLSSKFRVYKKLRRVYRLYENNKHLTNDRILRIKKIKTYKQLIDIN